MSLLFCDSFDHYVTAEILRKWPVTVSGTPQLSAGNGRRGTQSMRTANDSQQWNFAANESDVIVGVAIKLAALPASPSNVIQLADAGTVQVAIQVDQNGAIRFTRNGTALTDGQSANGVIGAGVFHYVEVKAQIANSISASSCVVRVNGVTVLTVATGQDTQNTANAFANQVRLTSAGTCDFDDFYLCDLGGSVNNDFLGDVRVDCTMPDAAGNYSQFTPSAGSNFQNVDESPDCDDDTTYNESSTAAHKDSYQHANLSALSGEVIKGVQVSVTARKDDAGARSLKVGMRSGSTDSVDAGTALATGYTMISRVHETNPNGGGAWDLSGVNGAESLVENV